MPTKKTSKSMGLAAVLLAILFILIFISAPRPAHIQASANVQPALLAMAAAEPDAQVRVIIQRSDAEADIANTVAKMNGTVIKELRIINAIVAEMEAARAVDLALDASVNWVMLDNPLEQSQTNETSTVRDEFGAYTYDNNNGTVPWASNWQEGGESDGPFYGYLRIIPGQLLMRGDHRSLARSVNLSGAETAVLTFDYRLYSFDSSSDYITVEISSDGGSSWRELTRLAGPASQSTMQSASYDISASAAANSIIRFATSPYLGRLDYFYADNIQIEYASASTTMATPVNDIILTVGDNFEAIPPAYNNNSGTRSWISDWEEFGDNNQPDNGVIYISQNQMGRNLALTQNYGYVWRAANLDGATYATLSFDYASALYFQDKLLIEASADGGLTWAELDRIPIAYSTTLLAAQYDISNYIASNTAVRFTAISQYGYPLVWLDNIQIEFDGASSYLPPNYYPETLGLPQVWQMGITGRGVGVAVIDSGIANDEDFNSGSGTRLLVQQNFNDTATTLTDTYGHGTHIAGIIAGNGSKSDGYYKGVAPEANLISLKIIGDDGLAYESDTVEAMQWVLEHKDEYNIRVVNLSINSSNVNSYHDSPLDIAAEILWFNDIVVVVSAGNRATVYDWFNPVLAPPANDPFVITVGASNELGSANPADDFIPFFSTSGITVDGYQKPEIIAPGKNIISVLASSSSWRNEYLDRVVDGNYFRISGTSMSAPMVAGAAALLLQAEPNLTPDQVKYRLVHTSRTIDGIFNGGDFPYLDVYAAVTTPTTESANQGVIPSMPLAKMALIAYWASQNGAENMDWSTIDWNSVNWDNVNWDAVDWDAVNWDSVNWGSVNWGSVNWGSVNWGSVNWGSVNWGSVNWGSVNWGSVNWGSVNWGSVNWGSVSWVD